ncbi:MAG: transcriptional repressor [Bacteroidetes bacterium]|nr:MAG: transcriptional repressor [Bacteroidota bacterium]
MAIEVDDILRRNSLSVTDSRKKILSLFLSIHGALAHGDIERKAGEKFDRVTVYRTLQTFVEKGIIHTIPTTDNSVRYALCKDNCTEGHHHDNHIHFICMQCGSTLCLEEVLVPEVRLPKGFTSSEIEVVIKGICKECNNKKNSPIVETAGLRLRL